MERGRDKSVRGQVVMEMFFIYAQTPHSKNGEKVSPDFAGGEDAIKALDGKG